LDISKINNKSKYNLPPAPALDDDPLDFLPDDDAEAEKKWYLLLGRK
jgi:hypothetical protein